MMTSWKKLGLGAAAVCALLMGHQVQSGAAAAPPAKAAANPGDQAYWTEQLVTGLRYPWAFGWLPNGDMLITERVGGHLRLFHDGKLQPAEIEGVPKVLIAGPWDGLMGLTVDPDFVHNQFVYMSFTDGDPVSRVGKVFRGRFVNGRFVDGKVIFAARPGLPAGGPIVMRIFFLPDQTMLIGVGSGDQMKAGMVQRTDNDIGKIIRIDRDGQAPPDNPFVNKPGYLPEIWAMGLRNPSGIMRSSDGHLWAVDIGPHGGDELNELKAGANYGWPLISWGFDYSGEAMSNRQEAAGYEDPVLVWSPSHTPSDLMQYNGTAYPNWKGDFFTGGLSGGSARRIRVRDGQVVLQERMLQDLNERIRSIQTGPDGLIYFITDSGRLLRIHPGSPAHGQLAAVAGKDGPSQANITNVTELQTERDNYRHDPVRGKLLFGQLCSSCHTFREFTSGKIGPDLNTITGRLSGTLPGYNYSAAFSDPKTRIPFRRDNITFFLAGPNVAFAGTKMTIAPVREWSDRANIADYLTGRPAGYAYNQRDSK